MKTVFATTRVAVWGAKIVAPPSIYCCLMNFIVPPCVSPVSVFCGIWCSATKKHYDDYVMTLYAQGVLTPNEWLDLGGLSSLSAEEYFGASLWQLYKSIDSIQSGAENTAAGSLFLGIPEPTSAGERYQTAFARRRNLSFGLIHSA